MTQSIKWSDTSDKEKVRLILEQVMEHFIIPEQYVQHDRWDRWDIPHGVFLSIGFHWPIAFWDDVMLKGWYIRSATANPWTFDPRIFTPLRNMRDTNMLVEHIAQRFPHLNLQLIRYAYKRCYATFSAERTIDEEEWSEGIGDYCMEEAICKAALRACNVEIR